MEYYDLPLPAPGWWKIDHREEIDRLLLMDGEFYMYKYFKEDINDSWTL